MRLTEEEKLRFKETSIIAHDDITAVCTVAGWERYKSEEKTLRESFERTPTLVRHSRYWWFSHNKKIINVECEWWVDARTFARTIAGPEVRVSALPAESEVPTERWQVGWDGSPTQPGNLPHLCKRYVMNEPKERWSRL